MITDPPQSDPEPIYQGDSEPPPPSEAFDLDELPEWIAPHDTEPSPPPGRCEECRGTGYTLGGIRCDWCEPRVPVGFYGPDGKGESP
jgi:hypothetical protein